MRSLGALAVFAAILTPTNLWAHEESGVMVLQESLEIVAAETYGMASHAEAKIKPSEADRIYLAEAERLLEAEFSDLCQAALPQKDCQAIITGRSSNKPLKKLHNQWTSLALEREELCLEQQDLQCLQDAVAHQRMALQKALRPSS